MVAPIIDEKRRGGVAPKGQHTGFDVVYDFKKGAPHIGDYSFYRRTYLTDPVVQTNINIPCRYVWKSGWYIECNDPKAADVVRAYLNGAGINQKGYVFIKDGKIFGMGYMEYTPEDLYIRNPDTMFVKLDKKGRIVGWEQRSPYRTEPIKFKPEDIIYFANNQFSDSIYGLSDIEVVR